MSERESVRVRVCVCESVCVCVSECVPQTQSPC